MKEYLFKKYENKRKFTLIITYTMSIYMILFILFGNGIPLLIQMLVVIPMHFLTVYLLKILKLNKLTIRSLEINGDKIKLLFWSNNKMPIRISDKKLAFEFSDEILPLKLKNDLLIYMKNNETDKVLGYIYKSTIKEPDKWEEFINHIKPMIVEN